VLEHELATDARWRAVTDGPWNCEGREAIIETMSRNLAGRVRGKIEETIQGWRPGAGRFPARDAYDGAGNQVTAGPSTYAYNALDEMSSATVDGTIGRIAPGGRGSSPARFHHFARLQGFCRRTTTPWRHAKRRGAA
jgi:hypothetical protein